MKKSKRTLYSFVVIAVFALASIAAFVFQNGGDDTMGGVETAGPEGVPADAPLDIPDDWSRYENRRLGFSMSLPPRADIGGGATSPVRAFDAGGSIVFIATEERSGRQTNTFDSLAASFPGVPAWRIETRDVSTYDQLVEFVRERFGAGCALGDTDMRRDDDGTLDLRIKGGGLADASCPVNYQYAIKFSPTKKKAAAWELGQAVTFTESGKPLDEAMVRSFAFDK